MTNINVHKFTDRSRDDRVAFLMQDIYRFHLPTRLANGLKNEGFTTLFSALSITESEFLRSPNVGKKSVKEFKELLAGHGLQMGETDAARQKHIGALSRQSEGGRRFDKMPADITTETHIATGELKDIIAEFIDNRTVSSYTAPSVPDGATPPDLKADWITATLPGPMASGISPGILSTAFNDPAFRASIAPHIDAIRSAAKSQIAKTLGFDKT